MSTVRVENVELATDGVGRGGSASGGFRPIKAEIFTVEQPKSRLRCACGSEQSKTSEPPLFP